jgi:hypothetical protein
MCLTCNLIHKFMGDESRGEERAEKRMVLTLRFGANMTRNELAHKQITCSKAMIFRFHFNCKFT